MSLQLTFSNIMQLFSLIAPLLLGFFLVMLSIFNQSLKGFVYLGGVLLALVINIPIMNRIQSPIDSNAPIICNIMEIPFLNRYTSPSPSTLFIGFTLAYLFLPMKYNNQINYILIAASVGVTVGGTSLIANSIGEKNRENILRYFGQTIIYGIILSILVTIVGLLFASEIFALMGSTTKVINLGLKYTNVIFSGSVIFISVVALNSLLHAEGDTKTFRNVLILSFFLNIILNPLFIFGYGPIPAMGMTGIGVATIICQIIAFLLLLNKIIKSKL